MSDLHTPSESLTMLLRTLRLPTFGQRHEDLALVGERQGWSFDHYLYQLAEAEVEERRRRRVERALKASALPAEKTLATLELKRFSPTVRRLLPTLCEGGFVQQADNVLAFGLPGRGKTARLPGAVRPCLPPRPTALDRQARPQARGDAEKAGPFRRDHH